jgi:branched-chain amino acid transport system ATP-binding protein
VSAVLEVSGLEKRFAGLHVIDDLSFTVGEEALGIVGPNGAGKTTMLNLVAGELRPDRGSVRFDGREITRLSAHRRARAGIGRTAQIPRPFDGLTVYENVLAGATFAAGSGRRARARLAVAALARTEMLDVANVRAGSLRLLDRKRLEIARALATRPRLLLLDEIAGGLTEPEIEHLVELIRAIRGEGVVIVWIEHVLHALLAVADRLIAMDRGRALVAGGPQDVMTSDAVRSIYLGEAAP